MADELLPGVLSGRFVRVVASAEVRSAASLTAVALFIENRAKQNASSGAHSYGSHTASSPGSGPSVISGDLRRSITHTPVTPVGDDLQTRVGPASTPHTDYGHGHRSTTSGKIGLYLETGDHGVTYPFLKPAFDEAVGANAGIWLSTFASGGSWT
jgi:hypothetical protein